MKILQLLVAFILVHQSFSQEARGSVATQIKDNKVGVKRALVVGISDYFSKGLKLEYADNDALLFKDYLSKVELIPVENINYLVDAEAVSVNIMRDLQKIMNETKSGDIAYIYFAGHGDVVNDFNGEEGFLLAADANDKQEYYGTNGVVSLKTLNTVIDKITQQGGKVILILDACRSGFLFKIGAQKNLETLNDNFMKSSKFLSCEPNELSYESDELQHGYFTYYLTLGLMGAADQTIVDGNIQYFELEIFLNENVNNETSKKQTPIIWNQKSSAIYRAVDAKDKTLALNVIKKTGVLNEILASRGNQNGLTEIINYESTNNPIVQEFNLSLKKEDYYGNTKSAYELYINALKNKSVDKKNLHKMKYALVKVLSIQPQLLINDYISGVEVLPSGKTFLENAKKLEICLEILDKNAFERDRILTSKLFLESYSIIRNLNFSNYKIAKNKLQKALKIQPRAAYIHNALGLLYNEQEKYDKSNYHYNIAKELIPSWALPLNNIAANYTDQFQYEKAKEFYFEALKLNGNKGLINSNIGVVLSVEGQYQKAEEHFHKALEFNPNNVIALRELGELNKQKGNIKLSKEWYKQAISKDTSKTFKAYELDRYITDFNIDDTKAEILLKKAIEEEPYYSNVYADYADFISNKTNNKKDLKIADSLYQIAIKNNPYNEWSYAGRGWLFHQLKNDKEAKKSFNKGIRVNSKNAKAYFNYAYFLHTAQKDYINAEKNYLKAIEKDQFHIPSYESLIELYNNTNQQEKAIILLNKLIIKNPSAPDFLNLLGDTYFSKQDLDNAILIYEKVIKLDSTYAKAYINLSYSLFQKKEFSAAKEYYILANHYNPFKNKLVQFTELLLAESRSKIKNNELDQAQELLEMAFSIEPNINSGYSLAEFYYFNLKTEKATTLLLNLINTTDSKSWEVKLFELGLKIAIDAGNLDLATSYKDKLLAITTNRTKVDLVLQSLYLNLVGKIEESKTVLKSVNVLLLNDEILKTKYSERTIQKIKQIRE